MVDAALGPMGYRIDVPTLTARGVIAKTEVVVVPVWQPVPRPSASYDPTKWHHIQERCIVGSDRRNSAILACMEHALADSVTPGIVFVRRKSHAYALVQAARNRGMAVDWVTDARKDSAQRQRLADALGESRLDFLIATKVFTAGVNIPSLGCVINGAGGKAPIDVRQQLGRATRVTDEKRSCRVYDLGDKGPGTLNAHAKARFRIYREDGHILRLDRTIFPEGDRVR